MIPSLSSRAALSVILVALTALAGVLNPPEAPERPGEEAWATAEAAARSVSLEGITVNLAGANAASVAALLDSLPGGDLQPALSRAAIPGTLSVYSTVEVPPALARRALEVGLAAMVASGGDVSVAIGAPGSAEGDLPARAGVFRDLEAGVEIVVFPASLEARDEVVEDDRRRRRKRRRHKRKTTRSDSTAALERGTGP